MSERVKNTLEAFSKLECSNLFGVPKVNKPPIGLKPKDIHTEHTDINRLSDVFGAISRYYNAGLPINVEWIEEYNELVTKYRDRI